MIAPPAIPFLNCIREYCDELPNFTFDSSSAEPFASIEYATERRIKYLALKRFWKGNKIQGIPPEPVAAPLPRHYRTTSKRKGVFKNNHLQLLHMGQFSQDGMRGNLQNSLLEPELHHKIYGLILEILSRPPFQFVARSLNYCIIRGSCQKAAVILNLAKIDASVVRKVKIIAEELQKEIPEVISCFLYLDESRSGYYLETKRPDAGTVSFKKLFGPSFLDVTLPDGNRLLYPPTGFSQVNEAMIPAFLDAVTQLIQPEADARLLDLYCGYGLIGLALAGKVNSVTGVEIDGPAVECAAESAKHLYQGKNIRYLRGQISPDLIRNRLPESGEKELQILDPPRIGTADNVIKELARRNPLRIVHIFCGTDEIPDSIRQWNNAGYNVQKVLPLDLFPGTPNLETMVLLQEK